MVLAVKIIFGLCVIVENLDFFFNEVVLCTLLSNLYLIVMTSLEFSLGTTEIQGNLN